MAYKLKLIRGRSYASLTVLVKAQNPFVHVTSKSAADFLVASKRFELVETPDDESQASGKPKDAPDAPDESWTISQLTAYAAENDIDLDGARAKADILAKIQEVESAIDYGEDE